MCPRCRFEDVRTQVEVKGPPILEVDEAGGLWIVFADRNQEARTLHTIRGIPKVNFEKHIILIFGRFRCCPDSVNYCFNAILGADSVV